MSQSFAHDGGIEPRSGASPDGSLDEQLAAEITDHLAAAAGDLKRRGEAEDEAARLALVRFGDVARVKRQCWWIHNGEEVMFRTVGIALLSLLTIGVAVVGFGGWQLQRNLASRTEEMSQQLASLTTTQQEMLAQPRPPEITGLAYLGDPSRPAKDIEIQVFRFSEEPPSNMSPRVSGVTTRRLRTDSRGHFDSGILQSGEYCVLGPLLDPEGQADDHQLIFSQLQSGPLYLTAGVGNSTVELDLAASGRIRLAVTNIPNSVTIADEEVRVLVSTTVSTEEVRKYFERRPVPPSDEPPRGGWPLPLPPYDIAATGSQRPADLPRAWWLPPRDYSIALNLSLLRTKKQGSQPAPFSVNTKWVTSAVKLTPNATAILTVSVPGDPLEKRIGAAVNEFERNSQAKLGIGSDISPILKSVADEIELNVALDMEETAVAR